MSGVTLSAMFAMNRIGWFVLPVKGPLNRHLGRIVRPAHEMRNSTLTAPAAVLISCRALAYSSNSTTVPVKGSASEHMMAGNASSVPSNRASRGVVGGVGLWLQVSGRAVAPGFTMLW